jgi:hypothetical protein
MILDWRAVDRGIHLIAANASCKDRLFEAGFIADARREARHNSFEIVGKQVPTIVLAADADQGMLGLPRPRRLDQLCLPLDRDLASDGQARAVSGPYDRPVDCEAGSRRDNGPDRVSNSTHNFRPFAHGDVYQR